MAGVVFEVSGVPVAKGRPRFTRKGFSYTPSHTRKYEDVLKLAAGQAMGGRNPFDEPLTVSVTAVLPIPASWSRKRQAEARSEERRVGKECVSTCRSRWSPYP